jgi:hypothetical protein
MSSFFAQAHQNHYDKCHVSEIDLPPRRTAVEGGKTFGNEFGANRDARKI